MPKPDPVWNPPERTGRQRRNARVKVVGSLVILLVVLALVVLRLLA